MFGVIRMGFMALSSSGLLTKVGPLLWKALKSTALLMGLTELLEKAWESVGTGDRREAAQAIKAETGLEIPPEPGSLTKAIAAAPEETGLSIFSIILATIAGAGGIAMVYKIITYLMSGKADDPHDGGPEHKSLWDQITGMFGGLDGKPQQMRKAPNMFGTGRLTQLQDGDLAKLRFMKGISLSVASNPRDFQALLEIMDQVRADPHLLTLIYEA